MYYSKSTLRLKETHIHNFANTFASLKLISFAKKQLMLPLFQKIKVNNLVSTQCAWSAQLLLCFANALEVIEPLERTS